MNKAAINDLRARAERAASLDEVRALLAQAEFAAQAGSLRYRESGAVFLEIYTAARRLSEDDPQAAREFLLGGLLPLYIRPGKVTDHQERYAFHQCRELANEWLNSYCEDDAKDFLGRALGFFADQLESKERAVSERACWAIQGIGYRDPGLLARLRSLLAKLPGARGDEVLRAIVDLGVPTDERSFLREEMHRRARRRLNSSLFHVLRELADESTFELLFGAKPPRSVVKASDSDLDWLMSVLSHLAERAGAGPLCDEIVRTIERLYWKHPKALDTAVYLGGYLLPHCDSPETPRFIATLLTRKDETEEKTAHALWLLDLRLQACARPAQQSGRDGALNAPALAVLRARALAPGSHTDRATTFQDETRRSALDTALAFGAADALGWFEPMLDNEGNAFVLHELLETYSSFHFEPLPAKIRQWITEQKDEGDAEADVEWMWRTNASLLARSAGSEEAFGVLLRPGFTLRGDVMRSTVDALADVALALSRNSAALEASVIERLLAALTPEVSAPQASAVCHALALLAADGRLPVNLLETILRHARNTNLRTYPRSQLIFALGFLLRGNDSAEAMSWLVQVAEEDDDWLGWRASEALARLDALTTPGNTTRKLGLEEKGVRWTWSKDSPQFQWSAGIVARLYGHRPEPFAPAVIAILHDGDFAQAAQLLPLLKTPAEPAVIQALAERILTRNTPRTVEFGLFMHLGRLAPAALATGDWLSCWTNWLPEARVDLANALCRCLSPGEPAAEGALRLLVPLLGDGHFAVRRAAARALGRLAPGILLALCGEAASSGQVTERVRTAELLVWLPATERGPAWQSQWESLLCDRHKTVRAAAAQAHQADQRRAWGLAHLGQVVALRESTDAAMLACWRYGHALARTGDDEAHWLLLEHLADPILPLNVRFFKSRVAKELEKLWNEAVKKKWPEPVAPARGSTEAGQGIFVAPSGKEYPVSYMVWRSAATIDHAGTRWGGSAQVKGRQSFEDGMLAADGTFRWEDGRSARVRATNINNLRSLLFSGSGAYPLTGDDPGYAL